ncbi:MAG: alpha/beta fold hydrolase [Rhizobiales bacterium]|nr:alpha/beta fold hydrolase [Hyphomicrobiales bacterium]
MRDMRASSNNPVVLLHGTAGKPSHWAGIAAGLSAFEVRMPSLPGHCVLCHEATGGLIADEAYRIAKSAVGPGQRVHLVGHSYGGAVALKLAMAFPERIKSLTLIEPAVFHLLRDGGHLERQMYADIADVEVRLRKAHAAGDARPGVSGFVDFWCGGGSFARFHREKQESLVAMAETIIGNFTSVARENWPVTSCAMVKAPMLAIIGSQSPVLVQHLARMIAGAIDDAKVIQLSEAGHMLPLTHAGAVAQILTHHFQRAQAQMRFPRAA